MTDKIYEILNGIRPECDFRNTKDFLADQLLQSLDIVLLVSALEEAFSIQIDALDIVPEYFVSVSSILELIQKSGGVV